MPNSGRDSFNFVEQVFLWCAGTNEQVLQQVAKFDPSEAYKRITTGGVILLTSLMVWVSFAWAMTTFIEGPTPPGIAACVAAGLLVSGLKLLWDRRLALAESTRMAWLRIPLAVPLSLFSAIPLLTFLMGGHLSDALEKSSPDIFSQLNLLVRQATNDPVMGATALILVLIYLTFDLLPAIDRILDSSQYHRMLAEKRVDDEMKRAADEMERRKRQWIERIEDV